jgi:hypothetical protein
MRAVHRHGRATGRCLCQARPSSKVKFIYFAADAAEMFAHFLNRLPARE